MFQEICARGFRGAFDFFYLPMAWTPASFEGLVLLSCRVCWPVCSVHQCDVAVMQGRPQSKQCLLRLLELHLSNRGRKTSSDQPKGMPPCFLSGRELPKRIPRSPVPRGQKSQGWAAGAAGQSRGPVGTGWNKRELPLDASMPI